MWKEVTIASIEMSASVGGCREGEVRWKLGNSMPWLPKVLQ